MSYSLLHEEIAIFRVITFEPIRVSRPKAPLDSDQSELSRSDLFRLALKSSLKLTNEFGGCELMRILDLGVSDIELIGDK